jgi:hypothetical protein
MPKKYLHSSITDSKLIQLVEQAAVASVNNGTSSLGHTTERVLHSHDEILSTKVWGFNRNLTKMILEVIINGVSLNKVVLGLTPAGGYRIVTHPRFIADYKRKVTLTA